MKIIQSASGLFCSVLFIFILFITSIEAVAYWSPGYYEKEYTKYQVADAVSMEMTDLLYVTDEMMKYLKGQRPDLHISTTVGGQQREFFNQREIAHMEDVRFLFIAAIRLRRCALFLTLLVFIFLNRTKADVIRLLAKSFCLSATAFISLTVLLGLLIATDFTKYFTFFHHIFFNNDLWILDPRTDLLINIVPEPFFIDTASRIGITFFSTLMTVLFISITILKKKQLR